MLTHDFATLIVLVAAAMALVCAVVGGFIYFWLEWRDMKFDMSLDDELDDDDHGIPERMVF